MMRGAAMLAAAVILTLSGGVRAGEQYVDGSGFALSGYDPVAYRGLAQAPFGEHQPPAVPGRADFTAEYNGATWAFSTAANRDAFLADPAKYAPAYDGHCAFGVAKGGKAPGNPHLWRILDGKLYLNVTRAVVGFWEADIDGNLTAAERNWSGIEDLPANDGAVPELDGAQAPVTE